MHAFYLHGFASSARSSKAAFLGARLRAVGVDLHTPDLNEPDFRTLTITRMVGQVAAAVDALGGAPVTLIGSSLGAFVAVQAALTRRQRVERLVLLAPALDFGAGRGQAPGGASVEAWRAAGELKVFHYGYGRLMSVHYELYADACRYDCLAAELPMPVQVFQGTRDDVVDPEGVQRWAAARSNVELQLLDDDHQLAASLDDIWRAMARFMGLAPEARAGAAGG